MPVEHVNVSEVGDEGRGECVPVGVVVVDPVEGGLLQVEHERVPSGHVGQSHVLGLLLGGHVEGRADVVKSA